MKYNLQKFSLRIDGQLLSKLSFIADYQARSTNRQLVMIIRQIVRKFEKEHGEIALPREDD